MDAKTHNRNQVLMELDSLIAVLEAKIPASPAQNENIEKGLERDMADYFRRLDMALDWNAIEALYYRHVKQEA